MNYNWPKTIFTENNIILNLMWFSNVSIKWILDILTKNIKPLMTVFMILTVSWRSPVPEGAQCSLYLANYPYLQQSSLLPAAVFVQVGCPQIPSSSSTTASPWTWACVQMLVWAFLWCGVAWVCRGTCEQERECSWREASHLFQAEYLDQQININLKSTCQLIMTCLKKVENDMWSSK